MKQPISKEEVKRLSDRAIARFSTEEGLAELREVFRQGEEDAKEIMRLAKPTKEALDMVFGPIDK